MTAGSKDKVKCCSSTEQAFLLSYKYNIVKMFFTLKLIKILHKPHVRMIVLLHFMIETLLYNLFYLVVFPSFYFQSVS